MPTASVLRHRLTLGLLGLGLVWMLILGLRSGVSKNNDALALVGLADTYGLWSTAFLYLSLLVSPLAQAFPHASSRKLWYLSRRGLGLLCLLFAIPHTLIAFFGPLGGFPGLAFVNSATAWSLLLGLVALAGFVVMGATANDFAVAKLGPKLWKSIHRIVYALATITLIHIVLIGNHFADPHSLWSLGGLALLGFLLWLQALRFDKWWFHRKPEAPRFGPASLLVVGLLVAVWLWTGQKP